MLAERSKGQVAGGVGGYLEVVVYTQEVVLQGEGSAEALLEVFDSQFGEVLVEPLHQLLHHHPHVLKAVALNAVAL